MGVVVVFSGGLDSTTLLYKMKVEHGVTSAVSFNYGQKHKKELEYAAQSCARLNIDHHIIDLSKTGLVEALAPSGSSLVTDTEVPEGHYAEDNMKSTVVPNRNMLMISIAGAIAVAEGATAVAVGVHAGDHFVYPDCRPVFVDFASKALYTGNEGFGNLWDEAVIAPFIHKTKEDIAREALFLGVPLDQTWSCYNGREFHCGKCGTCVERLEAIEGAIVRSSPVGGPRKYTDYTIYEDNSYWREVIAGAEEVAAK